MQPSQLTMDQLLITQRRPSLQTFLKLFIIICVLAISSIVHATSFNYSYTFDDNKIVSGSFTGTASGNLITNLSNITLSYNGIDYMSSFYSYDFHGKPGGTASFDGLQNSFNFADSVNPATPTSWTVLFYSLPGGTAIQSSNESFAQNIITGESNTSTIGAKWLVTPQGGTPVPTPEPGTIMLMGSGVLGMLGFRRRQLLAYFRL
jgi:hypothetical protein